MVVLHADISIINDDSFETYLNQLPTFMHEEILRYRFCADQKTRLLARLILQRTLITLGKKELMHQWERTERNKPVIKAWKDFSIAHSRDKVILAFGDDNTGADVEKRIPIDFEPIVGQFHPEEQEYILASNDPCGSFYDIWVKKEAVLKAIGVGVTDGLNDFSAVGSVVSYRGRKWYLLKLDISPDYTTYVTSSVEFSYTVKEFKL